MEELGRVKDINQRGISMLLVEQNVYLALKVTTRGYALRVGSMVLEGDLAIVMVEPLLFGGVK